jgi:uncharacterized membrane protein YuzA (DUF378 family)
MDGGFLALYLTQNMSFEDQIYFMIGIATIGLLCVLSLKKGKKKRKRKNKC